MSVHVDPQQFQILEHRERMLAERLKAVQAKQYALLQEEGQIRSEMQRTENEKYALLDTH